MRARRSMRRAVLLAVVVAGLVAGPAHASTALMAGPSTAVAPQQPWVAPLAGTLRVDRIFAPPATAFGAGHRGVDLRGTTGQPVLAAGGGRVSYAGLLAGRGVVTVVHPAGLKTTYEPVTASVRVGQVVRKGEAIGVLASGHCRDGGTCLHWGLLRGSDYLDPLSLLGTTAVRLLQLDGADDGGAVVGLPAAPEPSTPRASTPPTTVRPVAVRPVRATPATEPRLLLRATDRGLGVGALLLLVVGLSMIMRRPSPRPGPGPAGAALNVPIDLGAERQRRRVG